MKTCRLKTKKTEKNSIILAIIIAGAMTYISAVFPPA